MMPRPGSTFAMIRRAPLVAVAVVVAAALAVAEVGAVAAPSAAAGSFEAVVRSARPIRSLADLAALFWSRDAECKQKNDLRRRQCKGVRAARAARVQASTYKVEGDADAVTAGAFNARRGTLPIALHACLACAKPVSYGGTPVYVVGGKTARVRGGVTGKVLARLRRKFASQGAAAAWKANVLPRLRVDLVVRVPAHPSWRRGGKRGFSVKVVGYRVYDPCDGSILFASPKAQPLAKDTKACGPAGPPPAPGSQLPAELTPDDISSALAPARAQVAACHKRYGGSGTAMFRIAIAGDGHVTAAKARGGIAGTPLAACIAKAVKKIAFPKAKRATRVTYPFVLQ